jgi:hypothetical protein
MLQIKKQSFFKITKSVNYFWSDMKDAPFSIISRSYSRLQIPRCARNDTGGGAWNDTGGGAWNDAGRGARNDAGAASGLTVQIPYVMVEP